MEQKSGKQTLEMTPRRVIVIVVLLLMLIGGAVYLRVSQRAPKADPEPVPEAAVTGGFSVLCRLEDGTPVPGAQVEVCSGSICRMQTADSDGRIVFYTVPGTNYDVNPVRAPEGYTLLSDRSVAVTEDGQKIEFLYEKVK